MNKSLRVIITGSVQGVFFRQTAKKIAEGLNLVGFAQNKEDGSVYLEVEGNEENLNQFLQWCRVGPKDARVENIEAEEQPLKNFKKFEIY